MTRQRSDDIKTKPTSPRRSKTSRLVDKVGEPINQASTRLGGKLAADIGAYLDAHPPRLTKQQLAERYLADVLHAWGTYPAATLAQLLAVLAGNDEAASGATFERAIAGLVKAHRSRGRSTSGSFADEVSAVRPSPASSAPQSENRASANDPSQSKPVNPAGHVGAVENEATTDTQPALL